MEIKDVKEEYQPIEIGKWVGSLLLIGTLLILLALVLFAVKFLVVLVQWLL
jgi:hypothetical protein